MNLSDITKVTNDLSYAKLHSLFSRTIRWHTNSLPFSPAMSFEESATKTRRHEKRLISIKQYICGQIFSIIPIRHISIRPINEINYPNSCPFSSPTPRSHEISVPSPLHSDFRLLIFFLGPEVSSQTDNLHMYIS